MSKILTKTFHNSFIIERGGEGILKAIVIKLFQAVRLWNKREEHLAVFFKVSSVHFY